MTDKKPRARRKKRVETPASLLVEALKFLKPCQSKSGTPEQQFCTIRDGWAIATNEVLTIGTRVEEPLNCCPQTFQLIDALSRVDGDLAMTQITEEVLAVTAGSFRALVQCLPTGVIACGQPDPAEFVLSDALKPALAAAALLAGNEARPEIAPVLLQAQTAVGTNGFAVIEHWHGIDLPPNILLPKAAALAVAKCGKTLAKFGFSQSSFTFWFEDESFIKTQLYGGAFANYNKAFEGVDYSAFYEAPEEFFKALEYVRPFAKEDKVIFKQGKVCSSFIEGEASTYELPFLPEGMGFNAGFILQFRDYIEKVQFVKEKGIMYFTSQAARGGVMGLQYGVTAAPKPQQSVERHIEENGFDDDIPF